MKFLLLLHLLLFSPDSHACVPDSLLSIHCSAVSWEVFHKIVEEQSGKKIYYNDRWVKGLKISVNADQLPVHVVLTKALAGTGLEVSSWNNDFVLLPGTTLPESLPVFANLLSISDTVGSKTGLRTQSEERYLNGRSAGVISTIVVGRKSQLSENKQVTIRGKITEVNSGEPVIGATMYIEELNNGTVSDLNGNLIMKIRTGRYQVVFAYMGMVTKKCLLEVYSEGDFSIELERSVIQMKELVVYGDKQMSIRKKDPGLEKIIAKSVKEIPMLLGEKDILKVSEMLPGIVTVGEGSSGLNVRGGNYDQNAFFINNVPVYNPSHLFGFFSSFNSDIVKDFSVYKGYIPLKYGGRLSSVFNIVARQGNRKKYTAHGGMSPIAANISIEGPLKKDTSSFLISARALYSDWLLEKIKDPVINSSKAAFNDWSFSWNYDFKKTQLSVFTYNSRDKFQLADLNGYEYANNGISIAVGRDINVNHRGNFSFAASRYSFAITDQQFETEAYHHDYHITDYRLNADFSLVIGSRNTLEYGLVNTLFSLDRGNLTPYGVGSLRKTMDYGREQGIENALYLSDKMDLFPWLSINAGVRLAIFSNIGPSQVYTYTPGNPKNILYIEDTLNYSRREFVKSYFEPDGRISVNIVTDENGNLKLSFTRLHQNIFILNKAVALAPDAQWKLADYHLEPAMSDQFSAGVFRTFPEIGLEASFEAYWKSSKGNPEFLDGVDFLKSVLVETTYLPGKHHAYGIEFLLKRTSRRLEGWLSYTYSRSFVKVDGLNVWQVINKGLTYPANYDIPHVLDVVMNYHFNKRYTASTVISYQTGKPVTYPISVYYLNGLPYVEYSGRNAYRIPDYFRIDLSFTVEGNLRKRKPLHNAVQFSVYNVTGRQNPYSVYFTSENGRIKSYMYSVIGVPVFTVSWTFKLGNYASD